MNPNDSKSRREFDWFDRPGVRRLLWRLLYGACALSVLIELAVRRHSHFGVERWFGFYAALGFVACALMILVSKALGHWLKVKEDYYDDEPR